MDGEGYEMTKLAWVALLALMGCHTPQGLSQGNIPCAKHEMAISNKEQWPLGGPTAWTVTCHGKRYYCSARYGQYSAPNVDCIEAED